MRESWTFEWKYATQYVHIGENVPAWNRARRTRNSLDDVIIAMAE